MAGGHGDDAETLRSASRTGQSSLIKEILMAGGSVDEFVPPPVVAALSARG